MQNSTFDKLSKKLVEEALALNDKNKSIETLQYACRACSKSNYNKDCKNCIIALAFTTLIKEN